MYEFGDKKLKCDHDEISKNSCLHNKKAKQDFHLKIIKEHRDQ